MTILVVCQERNEGLVQAGEAESDGAYKLWRKSPKTAPPEEAGGDTYQYLSLKSKLTEY